MLTLVSLILCAPAVIAAPPEVATSIKPVQALVKMVMGPLGTPSVIMPPNASPHTFSLKPSQAKMLAGADIVFWVGPGLETSLTGPVKNIAEKAHIVTLMETQGLTFLAYGETATAPANATPTKTDIHDHDQSQNQDHGHHHGEFDPHIWLSPSNALVLVDAIRDALIKADPENATDYQTNASKAQWRIKNLIKQTQRFTRAFYDTPYLVQHDGYGYLAKEFGLNPVGHLQTQPGRDPGARHIQKLMALIKDQNIKCLFHEPQFSSALARQLEKDLGVGLYEIDPLGIHLTLSDTTYVRLIQSIIVAMEPCLYQRKSATVPKTN